MLGTDCALFLSFSATVIWLPVLYATEHAIVGDNGLKTRCCRGSDSSHLLCLPHIFALVPFAQIRKDLPQIPKSLLSSAGSAEVFLKVTAHGHGLSLIRPS